MKRYALLTDAIPRSDDFHVIPTPELKQVAQGCPLLEKDLEGWIVCCSRRFFPLARRVAGDDSLAEDVLQTSWIKILQSIGHAHFDKTQGVPLGAKDRLQHRRGCAPRAPR